MDSLPNSDDRVGFAAWEELGAGAPTIVAYARLCSLAMLGQCAEGELSQAARAILFAARNQGVLEIKGSYTQFEAPNRLLAVCVQLEDGEDLVFKSRSEPERTVRMLEGFRELCSKGLILHHLFREFSLSAAGFERARTIEVAEVESLLREFDGAALVLPE